MTQTITFLEENMGKYFHNLKLGKDFLDRKHKTGKKIDKLDLKLFSY